MLPLLLLFLVVGGLQRLVFAGVIGANIVDQELRTFMAEHALRTAMRHDRDLVRFAEAVVLGQPLDPVPIGRLVAERRVHLHSEKHAGLALRGGQRLVVGTALRPASRFVVKQGHDLPRLLHAG